jgi:cytochrome c556
MNQLFDEEDPKITELKVQIARLQAQLDGPPKPTRQEERQGFSPNDKPRTWAEWQSWKKVNGKYAFNSSKVQAQVLRDANVMGKDNFFGGQQ